MQKASMRLTDINLQSYLDNHYGTFSLFKYGDNILRGVIPLLQNDYGEDNDCTLVSILTLLNYYQSNLSLKNSYNYIENVAKKYFYTGQRGTIPLFTKKIMRAVGPALIEPHVKYGKNIGYDFDFIDKLISNGNPVILSMYNDGRDFYRNHSVVIVGCRRYKINNKKVNLLLVYDNWNRQISYIDYNKLSIISSINYYTRICK